MCQSLQIEEDWVLSCELDYLSYSYTQSTHLQHPSDTLSGKSLNGAKLDGMGNGNDILSLYIVCSPSAVRSEKKLSKRGVPENQSDEPFLVSHSNGQLGSYLLSPDVYETGKCSLSEQRIVSIAYMLYSAWTQSTGYTKFQTFSISKHMDFITVWCNTKITQLLWLRSFVSKQVFIHLFMYFSVSNAKQKSIDCSIGFCSFISKTLTLMNWKQHHEYRQTYLAALKGKFIAVGGSMSSVKQ